VSWHLAQLNIARFAKPAEHPDNADFLNNIERVNAVAESQPGFIWRMSGDGSQAPDIAEFNDPKLVLNLTLWAGIDELAAFVYRHEAHRDIMRRRREWFEKAESRLVLWWVEAGHIPNLYEAHERLCRLLSDGPGEKAFTFRQPFPPPGYPVADKNQVYSRA